MFKCVVSGEIYDFLFNTGHVDLFWVSVKKVVLLGLDISAKIVKITNRSPTVVADVRFQGLLKEKFIFKSVLNSEKVLLT